MPDGAEAEFQTASAIASAVLEGIVIRREVEDILTISSAERHRSLKDGRRRGRGDAPDGQDEGTRNTLTGREFDSDGLPR